MRNSGTAYRIALLALALFGATSGAYARPVSDVAGTLAIDSTANRIGGSVAAMDAFFEKLKALRSDTTRVVSVLQIGDSHVQAGFYPAAVRDGFRRDFGSAGRGLIVPLKLAGTNEPPDYLLTSPGAWTASKCTNREPQDEPGIGGVALRGDGSRISFTITTPHEHFCRIQAFHHSAAPLLRAPDSLTDDFSCPTGDTEVSTVIPLRQSTGSVELSGELAGHYNTPVFYGFSLENGRGGVLYHSAGINGNTFDSESRAVQMVAQTALLTPDLIIVSLGTNDSFGRNFDVSSVSGHIRRLLELLREANPQSAMLLTIPMENFSRTRSKGKTIRRPNPNCAKVRSEMIRIAGEYDLPYWDFYTLAGGQGARERWYKVQMSNRDRVHLTREGYQLQGELLYRAISDAYRTYCTGSR